MLRFFSKIILKIFGWKEIGTVPKLDKYVVVFAPHTSNIDFVIGALFYLSKGMRVHFLIKKELFFFPLDYILKALGGIPVNRKNSGDLVDRIVNKFKNEDKYILIITPEGTRKKVTEWKKGFYNIATLAEVPIVPGYFDFEKKIIKIGEPYNLTGTVEEEMKRVKLFFKDVKGRHPERFSIGDVS
jgi:1-acyl-sn-glycerol-3-phosphate acyltransferase